MARVKIESSTVLNAQTIQKKDVVTLTVSNFGTVEANFFFNGLKRTLPAKDVVTNLPVAPFMASAEGHFFDIDLQFTDANSNIVVDYAYLITEETKC